jgi:predicted DNA-binding protein (MmcQ/YjbR family)
MNLETLRKICLSFPAATEQIQWGSDLVFKVGRRMFAVAATEPGAHAVSFKCSDEGFAELLEQEGIVPAPYMARARWVALERLDTLSDREIQDRLGEAYRLVFAKLTKKKQARISGTHNERSGRRRVRRTGRARAGKRR